jgi:CheY-like chemotaxis protein
MSTPSNAPGNLRIFVVENHAATLKYYRMLLAAEGHVVFQATTVAEALAAVPEAKCDVLISDVGLPDGDGWDLMRQLKEKGAAVPRYAIAVSGYGTNADRAKSRSAGFRHHLLKPFDPEELTAMLDEAAGESARGG